jgi:hypothetical protein
MAAAQGQNFKPLNGDWSLEGSLLWQTGSAPVRFNVEEIKLRYFSLNAQHNWAYRARLAPTFSKESSAVTFAPLQVSERNITQYSLQLALGLEKHTGSNNRLSAYYGGELVFGTDYSEFDATNTLDGLNFTDGAHLNSSVSGGFSAGLAALAGLDFYPVERLFLGIETSLLLGFQHLGYQQSFVDYNGKLTTNEQNLGTQMGLQLGNRGGIRLGFLF